MKRILSASILVFSAFFAGFSQQLDGPQRAELNPAYAPFYHGVASGDPLSDRVILWTRVTTSNFNDTVDWKIATNPEMTTIVNSGRVYTDTSKDFTVKVDATGLQPNTWYYYQFSAHGVNSIVGRTKTAPVSGVNNLRFAVMSCAQMPSGFFHAYRDVVNRNEVDAVLFLGDYLYEYSGTFNADTTRSSAPRREILSLADYRMRHSQYKLDGDLRECHRQYPWVAVWDDHEVANDGWFGGAQNHTDSSEGDWFVRKAASRKAYFEWMPIREASVNNDSSIHRTLHYGNLVDLIMLDTRYEGRDKQAQGYLLPLTDSIINDTTRSILGANQRAWFLNELNTSTAQWKIIGNQVMVAPLIVLNAVANADQWDGYPHDRKLVLQNILDNSVNNVVFLTGDIHTSWSNDIPLDRNNYNASTGAGSAAVEFVATSVTSGSELAAGVSPSLVQSSNPHMKYIDLAKRGYLLLDINETRTQGDHVHVSDITQSSFTSGVDASWYVNNNERFLRAAESEIAPRSGMPSLAPEHPTGIGQVNSSLVSLMCYPNPFSNVLKVQYYLLKSETVTASLYDISGKKVFEKTLEDNVMGLHSTVLNVPATLTNGNYVLQLHSKSGTASFSLVKE